MSFREKVQHKYALSEQGAREMIKAFISVTISDIVLMFPVGLLYYLVSDCLKGTLKGRAPFYIIGSIICLVLIAVTTYIQYNTTFLPTYVESGVRRVTLAEKLRKIPLSFFGKKDLSDLTSTIMADCATLETVSSHCIPELVGSLRFYCVGSNQSVSSLTGEWQLRLFGFCRFPSLSCFVPEECSIIWARNICNIRWNVQMGSRSVWKPSGICGQIMHRKVT